MQTGKVAVKTCLVKYNENVWLLFFLPLEQKVQGTQAGGPYRLAGYSFGACIAFEMALQLERAGQHLESLVLLDGSHSYVAAHTQLYKEKLTTGDEAQAESEALCAFMVQFMTINYKRVRIFWNWFLIYSNTILHFNMYPTVLFWKLPGQQVSEYMSLQYIITVPGMLIPER